MNRRLLSLVVLALIAGAGAEAYDQEIRTGIDGLRRENALSHDAKNESSATELRWRGARPGGHAPIGVMGDHQHGKGELMFSYRYMTMSMHGNRKGTDRQRHRPRTASQG